MGAIRPSILILASRYDLSCDYVVAQLRKSDCSYLRINSEDLSSLDLNLEPISSKLVVQAHGNEYLLDSKLKAVYYRRPVFLRDYETLSRDRVEQFQRHHWAVFSRSLMMFEKSTWINHPAATYYAEHKVVQLYHANKVGLDTPRTIIGNSLSHIDSVSSGKDKVVIKGLDTVLTRQGSLETFGYTKVVDVKSLYNEDLKTAPVTFQELIAPKIDLRVTVVGANVFTASILLDNNLIYGDWREYKEKVSFKPYDLPIEIQKKCTELTRNLGLVYAAIDLAVVNEKYYFLEINPTGEWAWLIKTAKLPIDIAIAETLSNSTTK